MSKKKIAILHDAFLQFGGAERTAITLINQFPHADIYTLAIDNTNPIYQREFASRNITVSLLNKLPTLLKLKKSGIFFIPMSLLFWEKLDLSSYDIVISSTDSYFSKAAITSPNTLHVCYMHSPLRYLYREQNSKRNFLLWSAVKQIINHALRQYDYLSTQRPDILLTTSQFTAKRIWKYYRRKASVVYPPIKIPTKSVPQRRQPKYYLTLSRLEENKHIDLAIKACNKLGRKLLVIGCGSQGKYLKTIAGPTISFTGFVPDQQLEDAFLGAIAQICPYENEDFGLTPLESKAYGIPVIAHKQGGLKETVISLKTGVFFDELSVSGIIKAVIKLESLKIKPENCIHQARKFSEKKFEMSITKVINSVLSNNTFN